MKPVETFIHSNYIQIFAKKSFEKKTHTKIKGEKTLNKISE